MKLSLLWRILFSTSIAITLLFAVLGLILQNQFERISSQTLEEEAQSSFRAYQSLWEARADQLGTIGQLLSRMPDVRAAFSTGDRATIRDTAGEVWDKVSQPGTLFVICDPRGAIIAGAGAGAVMAQAELSFIQQASAHFPQQARGFEPIGSRLYQVVVTPVYVASNGSDVLLNVLVSGIPVDAALAKELKANTGGSDYAFYLKNQPVAATLDVSRIDAKDYYQFSSTLADLAGNPIGELRVLRSFEAAQSRLSALRMRLVVFWVLAMLAGIGLTYLLARRLLRPTETLDVAASEIARGNYDIRVPVHGGDEIARLSETFNGMCESIQKAREELIRQERISTIGRLSTSIIHDLRNPLAAVYGGAEMLVDSDLSPEQTKRLSGNIYNASRQIQDLLQELASVTQGRAHAREVCRLREVIGAAADTLAAQAEDHAVSIQVEVPSDVELPLDRSPMERVFQNLFSNSIEAMPDGGSVSVRAAREEDGIVVTVQDTGPGIPNEIAGELFQPFVTARKKHGMGLGLALARKTVLTHGGDLWLEASNVGACFKLRLLA